MVLRLHRRMIPYTHTMTAIQEMTQRVAMLSAAIKEMEAEKSDLISQLSVAWSIGDLDEYIDDKGNAVIDSVRIERRSRTRQQSKHCKKKNSIPVLLNARLPPIFV